MKSLLKRGIIMERLQKVIAASGLTSRRKAEELIKDGINGYVFDPLNKENFVETLSKFHQSNLKSFGEESLKLVEDYTPEKAGIKIFNFCQELLNK